MAIYVYRCLECRDQKSKEVSERVVPLMDKINDGICPECRLDMEYEQDLLERAQTEGGTLI